MAYCSGRWCYQGLAGRCASDSSQAFVPTLLAPTTAHLLLLHDGARYHMETSQAVLLANAPRHRSKALLQPMPPWVRQGCMVTYLPSYAPELHLIEMLWRLITYDWLPFSA
jgi:hypothetical protein